MTTISLANAFTLSEEGKNDEAVLIIRTLAASGDPEALYTLAELTWRGGMVPQDPVRAHLLYDYAARLGHRAAGIVVTNLLASGVVGARDWPQALGRLAREAPASTERQRVLDLITGMDLDPDGDPVAVPESRQLSATPNVRLFRKVLTEAECAHVIEVARAGFEPSLVFDAERRPVRDPLRTSDGAALHWLIEDPAIHALNRRITVLTGTTYEQGEPLQALRYTPGQEYRPHFDFFEGAANRRLWTALIYLNDDYEGGETEFVRTGLKIRGATGDVLLFQNAAPGGPEPLAEHADLPVISGTKYLATRLVRETPGPALRH